MGLSTLSLIVLLASSAVQSAKSFKKSEICPCIPLNICPAINRYSKDDAKYFSSVLKCTEVGFVRCCPNNESADNANRRSDIADNIILIDDLPEEPLIHAEDLSNADDVNETTETVTDINELTTTLEPSLESDSTTIEGSDESITTEPTETTSEYTHESNFIDNSISVIYPNHKYSEAEKRKVMLEHLFLIFPNGEIEAAMATSTSSPVNLSEKPKRVIVRKRLIKKLSESLEGAESKKSPTVIEPRQMDVDEVKKRLSVMLRSKSVLSTTEIPMEESTAKRHRRKKIKLRKRKRPTTELSTSSTTEPSTTTLKLQKEKFEVSTMAPKRKVIYDTKSRMNFLKRPSSNSYDNDEPTEPEVITTTTTSTTLKPRLTSQKPEESFNRSKPALEYKKLVDEKHRAMIETVHKTLSAIHAGVDMKLVEKMLDNHRKKMSEIRQNTESTGPTKPYRGSARFRRPATTHPTQVHQSSHVTGTRTRNLSRTRNTATTPTTQKSVRKVSRTGVTQPTANPFSNLPLEDINMLPKQKAPGDFKASPLYGITMDKFNEFDNDMIDKIHETLQSPKSIQNGFFPVIQNGTPSTLL